MKKKLIIKQDGSRECGSAALLSILRYYGGNAPINKIVELTNTTKEGTTFYNIKNAAQMLGLDAKGYYLDSIDYLLKLNSPSLCQIRIKNYLHFIVVYKIKEDKIEIMDPAIGARHMYIDEFQKRWTGNIMIFAPHKKLINYKEEKIVNNIINQVLLTNKKTYFTILIISIIYTIASCIYSYYMKVTIDKVIEGSINNLILITIIFGSVVLIKNLTNLFRNNLLIYINEKIDFSILNNIYQKILLLPYNYFYNHKTGDIISRINDLSQIKQIINKITITVLLDGLILILASFILYYISPVLFKILVVNIIIYLLLLLIYKPKTQKYTKKIQENSASLNTFLVESISSFETIKGLSIEQIMANKLEKLSINNINTNSSFEKIITTQNFLKDITYGITIILIMYIGTKEIINASLSLTNFITFNTILIYFLEPIKNILSLNEEYQFLIGAINRVNSLFATKSINLEIKDNLVVNGNISIKNLDFSFNGYNNVLNNVSLDINNNNKVLILGPSGSGKSTLLKLLMKYYEVKRNTIFINDIDICDFSNSTIKNNITYISQNELIYTGTIKDNIILNRNVEEDKFLNICKITKVDEIIENLFLAYDTILEENAHNLSGGQRQRIILARTLINDSKILLIDEGLNQLDINLERKILKELFKLNKTIIIVSHRIDNMDLYNKVIKMKNGNIDAILDKEVMMYE